MIDYASVAARPLDHVCNLHGFECGEAIIDDWAHRRCMTMHDRYRARVVTYHVGEDINPVGLFSLKLVIEHERQVRTSFNPTPWLNNAHFPALHLEYLGVCRHHQNQGLGTFMLMEAIEKFCVMAETAGVPVLTLQPLNENLRPFYKARNFVDYGTDGGMLLTAQTALELHRTPPALKSNPANDDGVDGGDTGAA